MPWWEEDGRIVWENIVIGIVGWAGAAFLLQLATGRGFEELNLGVGLLALLVSVVFVGFDERRSGRRKPPSSC